MNTISYVSILESYNIKKPTWSRKDLQSQIDDLWVPLNLVMDFELPLLTNAEEITNSDHKIFTTSWKTNLNKKRNDSAKKRKKRQKVYKYDKMKEEDWVNFRSYIDKDLQKHRKV